MAGAACGRLPEVVQNNDGREGPGRQWLNRTTGRGPTFDQQSSERPQARPRRRTAPAKPIANPGNRQDNRSRGNASQLLEKYKSLARDAQLQGDRVQSEYYLQYADHYFRVLNESRARFEEQRRQRDDYGPTKMRIRTTAPAPPTIATKATIVTSVTSARTGSSVPNETTATIATTGSPDPDRSERDDRGERNDRPERNERPERNDRPEREERPVRAQREFREERNGERRPDRQRARPAPRVVAREEEIGGGRAYLARGPATGDLDRARGSGKARPGPASAPSERGRYGHRAGRIKAANAIRQFEVGMAVVLGPPPFL